MRIGHFAHEIWAPGGIASFIRRLGDSQQREGHTVTYYSYANQFVDDRGFIPVANLDELYSAAASHDILHVHQEVEDIRNVSVPVIRTMHENQSTCPSGSRFLRERGTPCDRRAGFLACSRGLLVDRCGSVKPGSLARYYRRYRADQHVLPLIHTHTVSEFLRLKMTEAGYPSDRIHTILHPAPESGHGRSSETPPPPEGLARFLFVGRVVPSKGLQWLLRAAAESKSQFEIDVAGDGYGLNDMRVLATRLGMEDRVTFHGWVDSAKVSELFARSRAVVFPSIWHEPAGLVTVEAAAHGRAVIASRVGGIPEYADEKFARLLAPYDVRALTDAMDELANDRALAARMGRAGQEIVSSGYTMAGFLERMIRLYDLAILDYRSKRVNHDDN
jgi:glycosyltransferase involved in cell wall biosynthesis